MPRLRVERVRLDPLKTEEIKGMERRRNTDDTVGKILSPTRLVPLSMRFINSTGYFRSFTFIAKLASKFGFNKITLSGAA